MLRPKIRIDVDSCCKFRLPSRRGPSACGVIASDETSEVVGTKSKYLGKQTPPQAEYSAIIFALENACGEWSRNDVTIWSDNEIVVNQLNGECALRSENIKPLYDEIKKLEGRYVQPIKYFHHSRETINSKKAHQIAEKEFERNHT